MVGSGALGQPLRRKNLQNSINLNAVFCEPASCTILCTIYRRRGKGITLQCKSQECDAPTAAFYALHFSI